MTTRKTCVEIAAEIVDYVFTADSPHGACFLQVLTHLKAERNEADKLRAELAAKEAEIKKLTKIARRALCGCTQADCVHHGAWVREEVEAALELRND